MDANTRDQEILQICRDFSTKSSCADKRLQSARNIIQRLFKSKSIDLCSILPNCWNRNLSSNQADHNLFNVIHETVHSDSVFFETVSEDENLSNELWDGILGQCERTMMHPDISKDSIMMVVLASYVEKLLPVDEEAFHSTRTAAANKQLQQQSNVSKQQTNTSQSVRTPLQLFLPSSSLVNRINIDETTQLGTSSGAILHPRHINIYCSLLIKACSTANFPTPSRLLILRYLVKQYHVFCLFETGDDDVDSLKASLLIQPPFQSQLFAFLQSALEQCPTASLFTEITQIWLTYCRPWRYEELGRPIEFPSLPRYMPFAKKNYDFFRSLLGKIIRKFVAFEISTHMFPVLKSIAEFSWKEPQYVLLRNLGLNVQPHSIDLLQHVNRMRLSLKSVPKSESRLENWFGSMFATEDVKMNENRELLRLSEELLGDSDKYMATNFLKDRSKRASEVNSTIDTPHAPCAPSTSTLESFTTLLSSSFGGGGENDDRSTKNIPDHFVDARTNLMVLTPNGRRQVVNGERKFENEKYSKHRTMSDSTATRNEFAFLIPALLWLAEKTSTIGAVVYFADHYHEKNVVGKVARSLMYPPVPNRDPSAVQPVYSPHMKVMPPVLRFRALADSLFVYTLIFIALNFYFGPWFLIPSAIGILVFVILAMAEQTQV